METKSSSQFPPQRRYLTILFADLVGYTELSEQLDPEDLREIQVRYQEIARTVIERYGGFLARFSGDGILVYFGYPLAHENDAERALRAGLEIVERLTRNEKAIPGGQPMPALPVRIGVHTGLVVVGPELLGAGRQESGVVGEAVNLAARMQAEAPANSVVVSRETLELVEGRFGSKLLGLKRLKGISRTIPVYQVTGIRTATGQVPMRSLRGATRIIGRKATVDRVVAWWNRSNEESQCHTIVVVGEAGVGKTRLVLEVCDQLNLAAANIMQANCFEIFASTPLFPIRNFLLSRARINVEDDETAQIQKISNFLDEIQLGGSENIQVVASILGLTGTGFANAPAPTPLLLKHKQFALIVSVIRQIVRAQPTLLWIEDVHWLDPSSAEALAEIVAQLANTPVLVLLTTRSYPKGPALPAAEDVVHLDQLRPQECRELAISVPGAHTLSEELVGRAVEAAEGIPLFVEQLILALIDERLQVPNRRRHHSGLPLKLAELMSERLDRLPDGRRVVQAAACIGRSFTPDFLGAVLQIETEQAIVPLKALVEAEILRSRRLGTKTEYEFRHALLQRMAYESMVQPERRFIHTRIVETLKRRTGSDAIPEVKAHHLTEARMSREAIDAWLEAGVTAARRYANIEAIEHIRRGIGLLDEIPEWELRRETELNLQAALIGPLTATQGSTSSELSACCQRGMQLCREGKPTPLMFPFLFGQFTFALCRGQIEEATSSAEFFLSAAEANAYDSGRVIGHRLLGMVLFGQGEIHKAKQEIDLSLELYSPERDASSPLTLGQNMQVHSWCLLALALFCLGRFDEALRVGIKALSAANALRQPLSTALSLTYVGGWFFGLCGATEELMGSARRLIAISEQHRLSPFGYFGEAFLGWALCQHGDLKQGIAATEKAISALDRVHYRLSLSGHLANLADAKRRIGALQEAQVLCARAIQLISKSSSRWFEPEVRRIEALIVSDLRPQESEANGEMFRRAAALARERGPSVFEHRCLVSLRAFLGPEHQDVEVETRIRQLSNLCDPDRRVREAMQTEMSAFRA